MCQTQREGARGIAMHRPAAPAVAGCMKSVRLVQCLVPTRSFWSADPHPPIFWRCPLQYCLVAARGLIVWDP